MTNELNDLKIKKYNVKGHSPGLVIKFENQKIDTFLEAIIVKIPFENYEKICWNCDRNRFLAIYSGFKSKSGYYWYEICGD